MALDLTVTGIQHIGLPARDISETIDFYTSLGFDLDWQTPDGKLVFLKYGDQLLACYQTADMRDRAEQSITSVWTLPTPRQHF